MNNLLEPPPERDMPAGRAARMGADLTTTIRRLDHRRLDHRRLDHRRLDHRRTDHRRTDRHRIAHRRIATVSAVLVTAVAGVTSALLLRPDAGADETLAMSQAELSPTLRAAAQQCLAWRQGMPADVPATMADLAVAASRGQHSVVLFATAAGYRECEVTGAGGDDVSGVAGGNPWTSRNWMPGPVERLGLYSYERDGGTATVVGRVSDRVHRLVLDHGDGRTTVARVARGAFGVISKGSVHREDARLVAYDAQDREIARIPLLRQPGVTPTDESTGECYVDPGGTVVYGSPGPRCAPAEAWTH